LLNNGLFGHSAIFTLDTAKLLPTFGHKGRGSVEEGRIGEEDDGVDKILTRAKAGIQKWVKKCQYKFLKFLWIL
jgi:hypothetical protein